MPASTTASTSVTPPSRPGRPRSPQEILLPDEVWSGQLVRANVTPFAYDKNGVKGVSFALNHVQIIKSDRPRLDGRASASSAFDDGAVTEADTDESPF